MEIRPIFTNIANSIKQAKYSKSFRKEISELTEDLKNLEYKNIEITAIDKNNVRISAKQDSQTMIVDMDFKNRTQVQKEFKKSFALLPDYMLPNREWTQIIKGTLDGIIKRAKTITKSSNKKGFYLETTEYQNFISGNHFKREKFVDDAGKVREVRYFRNVDGDFVLMFKKKA